VSATGIALSPGRGFGPGGVGFVRFALVQPEAVLQQAAETVGKFAESLRAAHAAGACGTAEGPSC
jgi:aspartate/methionine/tyrosine aminotransferase